MRQGLRGLGLLLLVGVVCSPARARPSHDNWLKLRSPHFVVITDGKASQARDVAEHFERIRDVFLQLSPRMHVDPPEPVIILAVRDEQDLKKLLPGFWEQKGHMHPAGIFVSGQDRNYIALRMDANQYDGYHIVYHEYVHLLESLNFSSLPLWVREGLAEFYGAARIGGKDVGLGYPIPEHMALLRQGNWVPLPTLLTADESSPLYNENNLSSIFYAESWELTHYLLTAEKGALQRKFVAYIELFEKGVPSLTAAQETFGNLQELSKALAAYPHQFSYSYLHVKTSIAEGKESYPSHAIAPAEAEAIFGDFYARTDRPVEARAALDEAMRLDPKLPGPYESLGLFALHQRDPATALKWLSQAVALGSKDYFVYYDHATLSLEQSPDADLSQVVDDLKHCLSLNPNFAPAYGLLAQVYANRGVELDAANGYARRAIELDPNSWQAHFTLSLVLLRQRKDNEAKAAAEKALSLTHSDADREQVQDFLRHIQQMHAGISALAEPAQPVGPVLTTRPASTEPAAGPKPVPTPVPAAPGKNKTAVPAPDVYLIPEASVGKASCEGNSLSLLLTIGGSRIRLFAANIDNVGFVGLPASAKGAARCSLLEKQRVAVWFRPVHGQPYTGTILAIDLKH